MPFDPAKYGTKVDLPMGAPGTLSISGEDDSPPELKPIKGKEFDPTKYGRSVVDAKKTKEKATTPEKDIRKEKPLEQVMTPAEWGLEAVQNIGNYVKGLFEPQERKDVTKGDIAGAVGGGAAGGAAFGAVGPQVMKTAGKFIPGPIGKAVSGIGEAWSKVPPSERIVRGAGGGAGMGAVDVGAEALGAPKAAKFGAELAGSGIGEAGASFLTKEVGQMLKVAGMAAYGSPHGAAYAIKGMLDPNKKVNESMAKNLQKQLFGQKIPGYTEGLTKSDFQASLQEAVRAKDPSIPRGIPASTHYRNDYFDTITQATKQGKSFSNSPEFKVFLQEMGVREKLGQVTRKDVDKLGKALMADRDKDKRVIDGYAENLDNQIRDWAASSEKGGATGYKAVVTNTDKAVRADLQKAVNGYLQSLGKPSLETIYRQTYKAEELAESKDKIPYLISKYGDEKGKLEELASSIVSDPEIKPFLVGSIKERLGKVESKDAANEFERLDKLIVKSGLFDVNNLFDRETMRNLREGADLVTKTTNKGEQLARSDRFKRVLMRIIAQKGSVEAGKVAGQQPQQGQK